MVNSNVAIPSIPALTRLPATKVPTPAGVPVKIRSPALSSTEREIWLITSGTDHIWSTRGSKAGQQCIDLSTVLPKAFGVTNERFTGVELAAATNIFVGVTRARELLGLAMRKSEAVKLIGPAIEQGWKVVDLVAQAE